MKCIKSHPAYPGAYTFVRCKNDAKYGDYCGVHSPEKKAERAKKRGPTKWERECAERRHRSALKLRRHEALEALLESVRAICPKEPCRLRDRLEAFEKARKETLKHTLKY